MADIRLHNKQMNITAVPNRFIDEYMTSANGEYVKVYLYLLRCINTPGCDLSIPMIADRLDLMERDVNRALRYWEKQQLVHLEYDSTNTLSSIYMTDLQAPTYMSATTVTPVNNIDVTPKAPVAQAQPQFKQSEEPYTYTLDELAQFQEKAEIAELIFICSQYLGRQMNQTELNKMLFWYDSLKLSTELIEYLVEYSVGKNHTSFNYMNKIAIAWNESNITTVEQAKSQSSLHNRDVYTVMRAFGINGRNLVEFETDFVRKWTGEYGFTSDIITEACRRTLQAIQKPSFDYADTILTSWYKQQVHHLEDIAKLDSAFQQTRRTSAPAQNSNQNTIHNNNNKFNNFPQRSYDFDALERQLLENGVN